MANPVVSGWLARWASGLRFPWLVAISATLFIVDLFVPDLVPFADEILLGLVTILLGSIRKRRRSAPGLRLDEERRPAG